MSCKHCPNSGNLWDTPFWTGLTHFSIFPQHSTISLCSMHQFLQGDVTWHCLVWTGTYFKILCNTWVCWQMCKGSLADRPMWKGFFESRKFESHSLLPTILTAVPSIPGLQKNACGITFLISLLEKEIFKTCFNSTDSKFAHYSLNVINEGLLFMSSDHLVSLQVN